MLLGIVLGLIAIFAGCVLYAAIMVVIEREQNAQFPIDMALLCVVALFAISTLIHMGG